jgi:5,10-methylenetetrahydromethanopterin reductase
MRRIGLVFTGPLRNLRDSIRQVCRAEELGFDSAWQAEDPLGPDCVSLLSAYAMATQRIKLGSAIAPLYGRHPALLTATFASLDDLSDGRMILGLGAGMNWFDVYGLDRKKLRIIRDMSETIRTFRELLVQDAVDFRGRRFSLRKGFAWWPMEQNELRRAHIPVYIGAQGPQMVRLAGQVADGFIIEISPVTSTINERVNAVRAAALEAGRDPASIDVLGLVLLGVSRDGRIDPRIYGWVAPRLAKMDDAAAQARGFDLARMARLRAAVAAKRIDEARLLITPEMLKACGAWGTPDYCLDWLEQMGAAGVHPVIIPMSGDSSLGLEVGAEYARRG